MSLQDKTGLRVFGTGQRGNQGLQGLGGGGGGGAGGRLKVAERCPRRVPARMIAPGLDDLFLYAEPYTYDLNTQTSATGFRVLGLLFRA